MFLEGLRGIISPMLYRDSGVDLDKAEELVRFLQGINPDIGGFSGAFDLEAVVGKYDDPVLLATSDGIGTKILLGLRTGLLDGLGQDLVAMCANDLAVAGAEPLFFLDYFATERLDLEVAKRVLAGVVRALEEIGCALLGGETAELPGMLRGFDVAGFMVGVASRSRLPDPAKVAPGMLVLGLRSSGPHSNGFSLIRKVFENKPLSPELARALMEPTRLYVKEALKAYDLGAVVQAHVTGGGIPGNLIRVLPEGTRAVLRLPEPPEVFKVIQREGDVPAEEMARVFNLGWGLLMVVPPERAELIRQELGAEVLGEIEEGEREVRLSVEGL